MDLARLERAIMRAAARLRPHVLETPLLPSPALSARSGAQVYLKLEQLQHTGSFKLRGALNRLLTWPRQVLERGVVAASSGNHGLAAAFALERLGAPLTLVLPESAARVKLRALARYRCETILHGADCVAAEDHARRLAAASARPFLSPYNDLEVIAGQGTVAVELERQLPEVEQVLVAVGGGGLAAGIAARLKRPDRRRTRVLGCQPARSPVMARSIRAGRIVELPAHSTLSDGTAGGIEAGAVTFGLCRRLVDGFVEVSEKRIEAAMRLLLQEHGLVVEGAAALPVAVLLAAGRALAGRCTALVLCGRNVAPEVLARIARPRGQRP